METSNNYAWKHVIALEMEKLNNYAWKHEIALNGNM